MQQKSQLTNERLAQVYRNLKRWADHDNVLNSYISGQKIDPIFHDCVLALAELQELRKPNQREQVRREHAEWSNATFGDVGPIGPLKHLSKEALEASAAPSDLLEWADMQFLLWDAQRRMGISDESITRAMVEKLAINKARQWPDPKDGEPRLHIIEPGAGKED